MIYHNHSLCWDCEHACRHQCCWAAEFKPVPGWEAEYKPVKVSGYNTVDNETSYMVHSCPQFEKDTRITAADLDDDGAIALLEAICKTAGQDYLHYPAMRKEIANWMEGCDWILNKLIEEAEEYDRTH